VLVRSGQGTQSMSAPRAPVEGLSSLTPVHCMRPAAGSCLNAFVFHARSNSQGHQLEAELAKRQEELDLAAALKQGGRGSKPGPGAGPGKPSVASQDDDQGEEVVEVDAGDVVDRFKAFVGHAGAGLEGAEVGALEGTGCSCAHTRCAVAWNCAVWHVLCFPVRPRDPCSTGTVHDACCMYHPALHLLCCGTCCRCLLG
jgi:hypothetical protein